MSRSEAAVGLALQFWRFVLGTPWRERRGAKEILQDFGKDGVRTATPEERAIAPQLTRCTGCGRCDFLVPEGEPPSLLILRVGRKGEDAKAAWTRLQALQPHAAAIAAVCPEAVDVPRLIQRVRRLAESEDQ